MNTVQTITKEARPTRPDRIVLAEDDEELRGVLAAFLRGEGYDVVECEDGRSMLTELRGILDDEVGPPVDLVVSDVRMPYLSGAEALAWASAVPERVPVILMTAFGGDEICDVASELGIPVVLDKPFDVEDFLTIVSLMLYRARK